MTPELQQQERITLWRLQIAEMVRCMVLDGVSALDAFEVVRTVVASVERESFAHLAQILDQEAGES